jgi:hypothetical protein
MAGTKHGAWCHIEIPTTSAEVSQKFYGGVFGWKFTPMPEMKYTIYNPGEGEIGGGLWDPPAGTPRHITNYINVTDLQVAAKKVAACGGRVITDRMEVPGHGSFRMISDPDGNVLALWQSNAPAAKKPAKKAASKKKRR